MADTRKRQDDDERLDRLGHALVRASVMTDEELEAAASPFLYRRVWARIAAERERPAASATWLDLLLVGRRIVPAMLAVAVALAGWFWIGSARLARPGAGVRDPRVERMVLTGTATWSDDDLLRFLINWPVAAGTLREDQR